MIEGRPSDQRGFLHKKIFGGISRIAGIAGGVLPIPGLTLAGRIAGRIAGIGGRPRFTPAPFTPARLPATAPRSVLSQKFFTGRTVCPPNSNVRAGKCVTATGALVAPLEGGLPFLTGARRVNGGDNGTTPCRPPLIRDPETGNCLSEFSPAGAAAFEGNATLGQYGAGVVAGSVIRDIAVCPKKHVLGDDGVCYKGLANRNRMYPKGRAPLLTGGEMRAITVAGRAGKKLEAKQKTLQRLGLMKKPTRGRVRLPPHQHQIKVT